MKSTIALLLSLTTHGLAQPAVAPPQLGFVQDGPRSVRPAYGLAGNFILGPSVADEVISEAFGGSFGIFKTNSSLSAFDAKGKVLASVGVAPGPALFAFFPDGVTALAYIESSNALVEWRGDGFMPLLLKDQLRSEVVLAIAFPTPLEASLLVERDGMIWELNLPLGAMGSISQNMLVGVQPPVLALPSGEIVYRATGGMVIRRTDASEVHIAATLPASFSLQQMNSEWVQLTDRNSSARFAIRTTPGHESFYQLPEISRTSHKK